MAFRCLVASLSFVSAARYTWDAAWPRDNVSWYNATARPTAIALGTGIDGMEVHVTQRGNSEFPITTLDEEGNVLRRWGAPHVVKSHGLRFQQVPHPDGGVGEAYLWITDMGDYTVKKFDAHSGALLQTLGTPGQPGVGLAPLQFGNVSDVVLSPDQTTLFIADGDCLCTDGGANHRIVALDLSSLEVQWAVGNDGTFQNPHALDYDRARDWLWVADREHNRTVALDAATGEVQAELSVHDLMPAEHPPSINGLRVDNVRDALVLGLLPAPIHSDGGVFQVAAWDLKKSLQSNTHVSLYQEQIPLRGLHELDVHEPTGDLYLALFEAGYIGHLRFTDDNGIVPVPDFTLCNDLNTPPEILSYHVHVLFHGADRASMSAALQKHAEFLLAMGNHTELCPMAHSQPSPEYEGPVCAFPFEFDPTSFPAEAGGPFEAPNFSFFVPTNLLHIAAGWWQQHRRFPEAALDVLVHTNTGCQSNDHTTFAMWMGKEWEMNVKGLACCLEGPSGCSCMDTYYLDAQDRCLTADPDTGAVLYRICQADKEFDPFLMWHEVVYEAGYTELDSLAYSFGARAAVDACLGVASCDAGATVAMGPCGHGDVQKSRFSYDAAVAALAVDSCPGMCAVATATGDLVLGDCGAESARVRRRCVTAPGLPPTSCPGDESVLERIIV